MVIVVKMVKSYEMEDESDEGVNGEDYDELEMVTLI